MARILIVGLGRLGSRTAELLQEHDLVLCDFDAVERDNLEEQPFYSEDDVGKLKVDAAAEKLRHAETVPEPFTPDLNLDDIDCIVDGTDSLESRMMLNDAAMKSGTPLVIGTGSMEKGMVFPVVGSPCWQCVVKDKVAADDCREGIIPRIADGIASKQAELTEKILNSDTVEKKLILISDTAKNISVSPNPSCDACKGKYTYLSLPFSLKSCNGKLQARLEQIDISSLEGEDLGSAKKVSVGKGTAVVHNHGLVEFSGTSLQDASSFCKELISLQRRA
ncbi:hypothetical protein GOV11_02810 [Candidatus Woesearchaeota archaeon]|nr:hypothetical protein [Candidatus Woesearchaeota archaeon]